MNFKIKLTDGVVHDIPNTKGISRKLLQLAELTPDFQIGNATHYLSDLFGQAELNHLKLGYSAIISTEVGTGKSTAILKIAAAMPGHENIYILSNRKYCLIQLKREYLKMIGMSTSNWNDDAVLGYDTENVTFMTCQKLARKGPCYKFPSESMIVLDEIHYLLNDAVFSSDPMIIQKILHWNKASTKRIYISATMDEVLDEIIQIESKYEDSTNIHDIFRNNEIYKINKTLIDQIYLMESNWEHLCLKFYHYSDIDELATYLNENRTAGKKSLIFIRNKNRGEKLKEKLDDCEMVFSTDDEMPILSKISDRAEYSCGNLISTKVLENGISITDDKVDTIVIDELDPTVFKQFLGRVRNSRTKPRKLTLILPDYSLSELIQMQRQYYERIKEIQTVIKEPEYCMANIQTFFPYVYYDLVHNSPAPNYLALKKFKNLKNYVDARIEEEKINPHAHIHSIQRLLFLPEQIDDKQFLNYDDIATFKKGVTDAYESFENSPKQKADRDALAQALIKVVSNTNQYPKKITGSQLQLEKINDILSYAGIKNTIVFLGEQFGIVN